MKPFVSIVVPCYNSGKYISDLLTSIRYQGLSKGDIEVILVDDVSTEPYDDKVELFKSELIIRQYSNPEHYGNPAMGKELGASKATGEWIMFADHDDILFDNGLKHIKDALKEINEPQSLVYTKLTAIDINSGKAITTYEHNSSWTHGKLYNLDRFWKKYDIHYKPTLKTHDDIYISSLVNILVETHSINAVCMDTSLYAWRQNPESLSNSLGGNQAMWFENHYDDYITSTGGLYLDSYEDNIYNCDGEFLKSNALSIVAYAYFYMQGFMFANPLFLRKDNFKTSGEYVHRCKQIFKMSNNDIWMYFAKKPDSFERIRANAKNYTCDIIHKQSFMEFLNYVDNDFI